MKKILLLTALILMQFVGTAQEKTRREAAAIFDKSDRFTDSDGIHNLPIGTKRTVEGVEYSLAISSLIITSDNAVATVYGRVKTPDEELFFGPEDIRFDFYGDFIGETKLKLLGEVSISVNGGQNDMIIHEDGSYMLVDCKGFRELAVNADIVCRADNGELVLLPYHTIVNGWNEILESLSGFEVCKTLEHGLNGFMRIFIAYPNPSDGQFTVKVEMEEKADIHLRLVNIAGSIVDERDAKGSDRYEIYYELGNKYQGVYFLQLSSVKVNTSLKLLFNVF